jgi:aspartate/methionine/tyrosine aminotransferase
MRVQTKTSSPPLSGTALFSNTNYVSWYRELAESLRGNHHATLLFDSTMQEPSELIQLHARRALHDDYTERFPSTFGYGSPLLISAIAKRYSVDERSILTTSGCTAAISHVYAAFLEPGAHVAIETPHFDLLSRLAAYRGAHVTHFRREPGTFAIDPERLAKALTPQTRLIVLTNAHNPSGAYLDDESLRAIAAVANRAGIPVLVDEVYGDFVPPPERSGPAAKLDPCFISISSLTKVYGLHALRCGWIIASEPILRRIRPIYADLESGSSKLTHGIAALIFSELPLYERFWQSLLANNLAVVRPISEALVSEGLLEGLPPVHGNMYFPRLPRTNDTRALAAWMWDHAQIALAPGDFFGAPGYLRLGYGQRTEEVKSGFERFAEALRTYCSDVKAKS